MQITNENYYTQEAGMVWLSVSQFNDFVGTPAYIGCEARAMAKLRKEWINEPTAAMMIGSYVDEYFTGDIEAWKQRLTDDERKLIFTQKGELNASAKVAESVIERIKSSEYFMKYLRGEKQTILLGEIEGIKWRGKIDSLLRGIAIVDLKVVKSISEADWCDGYGKLKYVTAGAYARQGAVYQYLHRQMSGHDLPFYHAAVSKEKGHDIEIIHFPDSILSEALGDVIDKQKRIVSIKSGSIEPNRCGKCEYCRTTKVISKPVSYFEI